MQNRAKTRFVNAEMGNNGSLRVSAAGRWTTWTRTPGCCRRGRCPAASWGRRSRVCWPINFCGSSRATVTGTRRPSDLRRLARVRPTQHMTINNQNTRSVRSTYDPAVPSCILFGFIIFVFIRPLVIYIYIYMFCASRSAVRDPKNHVCSDNLRQFQRN